MAGAEAFPLHPSVSIHVTSLCPDSVCTLSMEEYPSLCPPSVRSFSSKPVSQDWDTELNEMVGEEVGCLEAFCQPRSPLGPHSSPAAFLCQPRCLMTLVPSLEPLSTPKLPPGTLHLFVFPSSAGFGGGGLGQKDGQEPRSLPSGCCRVLIGPSMNSHSLGSEQRSIPCPLPIGHSPVSHCSPSTPTSSLSRPWKLVKLNPSRVSALAWRDVLP